MQEEGMFHVAKGSGKLLEFSHSSGEGLEALDFRASGFRVGFEVEDGTVDDTHPA